MENIKFRAYEDGKMIYQDTFSILTENKDKLSHFFKTIRHDAIVMQLTGLNDRKLIDIYGGDIVKSESGRHTCVVFHGTHTLKIAGYPVYCNEADVTGWFAKNIISGQVEPLDQSLCGEVIGNIHENPDLLQ